MRSRTNQSQSIPSFAVVMPVYQGQPFLPEAVQSVLSQSWADFELIVGDDGSVDGSREYLQGLNDPRVRFFPQQGNTGLFSHLNSLLVHLRAPLVRFLCQDDVLEKDCLAIEATFFEQHPSVALAFSKYSTMGREGAPLGATQLGDLPDALPPMLAVQQLFYHGCIAGNLSTVSLRTEALVRWGTFDASFRVSGDYELWARIARHAPLGIVHRHLVRIRNHADQLSRATRSQLPFVVENARVRESLFPQLPAEAQRAARVFETRRHHVLDFHQALRCLLRGDRATAAAIFRSLGLLVTARAAWAWIRTLNNRIRPQAPWVLPSPAWE